MHTDERFRLLLTATPETLATVDAALKGRVETSQPSLRLYTQTQAAAAIGCSRQTIWRAIRDGHLRTVTVREGSRRIPETELLRFTGAKR